MLYEMNDYFQRQFNDMDEDIRFNFTLHLSHINSIKRKLKMGNYIPTWEKIYFYDDLIEKIPKLYFNPGRTLNATKNRKHRSKSNHAVS